MQMVQRPQWRRKAVDSGVLLPLVDLVEPGILDVTAEEAPVGSFLQQQIAYNMLVQVLMTVNWWAHPSPHAVIICIVVWNCSCKSFLHRLHMHLCAVMRIYA